MASLRRYAGAELFLCGDSIPTGAPWREAIEGALHASECLVFVGSHASFGSTYCAFEVGMATSMSLPVRALRVDDAPLPAWMAHLQVIDIPRQRQMRPWLTSEEALEDAVLTCLESPT